MKALLNEEITAELETLGSLENIGENKDYSQIVEGVTKLMDRAIEFEKLEADQKNRENELELQKDQHKSDKKSKTIQTLITVGTAILTAAITVWGTRTTLKFEEEGTVTTSAGKGFLGRLIPKK